jgi:hypothetical protein
MSCRYPLQAIASSKDQSCDRGQVYISILRYPSNRCHDSFPPSLPLKVFFLCIRRFRLPPAVDERLPDVPPSVVGAAASHTFKLVHLIKPTWYPPLPPPPSLPRWRFVGLTRFQVRRVRQVHLRRFQSTGMLPTAFALVFPITGPSRVSAQAYRCVECDFTSHNDCIKLCRVGCEQRRSTRSHSQ